MPAGKTAGASTAGAEDQTSFRSKALAFLLPTVGISALVLTVYSQGMQTVLPQVGIVVFESNSATSASNSERTGSSETSTVKSEGQKKASNEAFVPAVLHQLDNCNQCGMQVCDPNGWIADWANVVSLLKKSGEGSLGKPVRHLGCAGLAAATGRLWVGGKFKPTRPPLVRSTDSGYIFAIAGDIPPSMRPPPPMPPLPQGQQFNLSDIHFLVYTDSNFYDTRLKWLIDTWGGQLAPQSLTIIGDKPAEVNGRRVQGSNCVAHSHWQGACCKYAEAVYAAYKWSRGAPEREWTYFTDDDSYVIISHMVEKFRVIKMHGRKMNLGIFGCATKKCRGLCAGGGYALNRAALETLVKHPEPLSEEAFVAEQMHQCNRCELWADQAISAIIQSRHIEEIQTTGLNGWFHPEDGFMQSLQGYPLMYHYIRGEGQMHFLHRLFGPGPVDRCPGEGGTGPCATYNKRHCCAMAAVPSMVPWTMKLKRRRRLGQDFRPSLANATPAKAGRWYRYRRRRRLGDDSSAAEALARRLGLKGPWPLQAMADRFAAAPGTRRPHTRWGNRSEDGVESTVLQQLPLPGVLGASVT